MKNIFIKNIFMFYNQKNQDQVLFKFSVLIKKV